MLYSANDVISRDFRKLPPKNAIEEWNEFREKLVKTTKELRELCKKPA